MKECVIHLESGDHRLTDEIRLLALCSRQKIDQEREREFERLARGVKDWESLIKNARSHFAAGLLFKHLRSLAEGLVPREVLTELRENQLLLAAAYLKRSAAQRDLSENILSKHDFAHVFVKGNALALQCYEEPALRPARDIDVLIPASEIGRFWKLIQPLGYRRLPKQDGSEDVPIEHAVAFFPVIDLVSPTGVHIELHTSLDKSGMIFETDVVLTRGKELRVGGEAVRVADIHDHFLFICLHHSRHLFSHLHWLADIDAVMTHQSFDIETARERARCVNILDTVDACMDLCGASAQLPLSFESCKTEGGKELLEWCIRSLHDGVDTERSTRKNRKSPDFALPWQFGLKHRLALLGHRIKPTIADYRAFPLPRQWWWLYFLTRPFRLLAESLVARK